MSKTNDSKKNILRFIPMAVIMLIIFFFSSMEGDDSANTSGLLLRAIERISESISKKQFSPETLASIHLVIRKCAHFSEYAALGVSILFALKYRLKGKAVFVLWPTFIACLYAITDEIHQYFVAGRYGTWTDVVIDTCGAFCGIFIYSLIINRKPSGMV